MEYFQILHLQKEPFSNSPDPDFFYPSKQHAGCLQRIELAIRLRRGLNVVIGDVGTGKTTICRYLVRRFSEDARSKIFLILDPGFQNVREFLIAVTELFSIIGKDEPSEKLDEWELKERIKQFLFEEGVDKQKLITLVIDEGQKCSEEILEALREFLNYETNEYKLLQIVIFAQKEFLKTIAKRPNFADRINISHILGPLNFWDTVKKIQFRLQQASIGREKQDIFTWPAFWAIYRATGGYPRKILNLCHVILLALIIQNKKKATWSLVRSCIKRDKSRRYKKGNAFYLFVMIGVVFWFGLSRVTPIKDIALTKINELKSTFFISTKSIPDKVEKVDKVEDPLSNDEDTMFTSFNRGAEAIYPLLLGNIKLGWDDTIPTMIQKIYGVYSPWYLKYVQMVNPQMKDPYNESYVGKEINFPCIPVNPIPIQPGTWWIELVNVKSLVEAYQYIKVYVDDTPKICMLPYWNSRQGLRFSILLETYFSDRISALNYLSDLPKNMAIGRVIYEWDQDTVFFSKLSTKKTMQWP